MGHIDFMLEMKINKFFWLVLALYCFLGMHFFMHNQGGAGLYLPFNMIGWLFISLLIASGFWFITKAKQLVISSSISVYILAFAVLCLPFFFSNNEWIYQAEARFIAILAGVFLFFSLSQFQFDEEARIKLLYFLLFAVVLEILYGSMQFFYLKPGNWFGYNTVINRPYGIFQKDSVYSSFLASGLAISFYLLRWDSRVGKKELLIFGMVFISTPYLLTHIQSRAGIYGAILVCLTSLPVLWHHNKRIFWFSVFCLCSGYLFSALGADLNRDAASYTQTINFRQLYWNHALSMVSQSPWFGHGYGSFEYTFLHDFYSPENFKAGMPFMEENLDHPHNEILFWLHEGGIVAVIGLFIFAIGYLRSLFKCCGWEKRISLLALVIPLLFHSMVEYPFYHSVTHFFFFIVFLWLADAESNQHKVINCNYWFLARFISLLIPLIVVPFMLTGIQCAYVLTQYERMKDKQPQKLEQIVNPLPWMMLYEFDMRNVQLTFASSFGDKKGLENYVEWAKIFCITHQELLFILV